MAVSAAFRDYLEDLLSGLGPIRIKAMFGGAGVYAGELMFGLITDDTLYIRADAETEAAFSEAGSEPFSYPTRDGQHLTMSYWRAPEEAMENPDTAVEWARLGLDAARRKAAAKGVKKGGRKPPAD